MTTKSQSMKGRLVYLEEQIADYERNRDLYLATARRKDELAAQLYGAEKDRDYYRGRAERAEARVADLEAQIARLTFVGPPHLPRRDVYVEVLVPAKWEPRSVEAGRGRWCDQYYETLRHVRGWRPLLEQGEEPS